MEKWRTVSRKWISTVMARNSQHSSHSHHCCITDNRFTWCYTFCDAWEHSSLPFLKTTLSSRIRRSAQCFGSQLSRQRGTEQSDHKLLCKTQPITAVEKPSVGLALICVSEITHLDCARFMHWCRSIHVALFLYSFRVHKFDVQKSNIPYKH